MLSRLATAAIVIVAPFVIYHFYSKDYLIGIISILIIAIFIFLTGSISIRRFYYPKLSFWALIPFAIGLITYRTHIDGLTGTLWCYPIIIAMYCALPEKKAYIANGVLLLVIFPVIWLNLDQATSIRAIATLLLTYLFVGILINAFNKQQKKLQELVVTDPLTSLLNRTLLENTLKQAIEQFKRAEVPMTIAAFDLDHFKTVNDTHGHYLGDIVLKDVAAVFKNRCRKVDKVFRIGGEEFLIYFYNTSTDQALAISDELREKIENLDSLSEIQVTASIGLATLKENETWNEWLNRSDMKLYEAKQRGRNCVVV